MRLYKTPAIICLSIAILATPKSLTASPDVDAPAIRWPVEKREGRVYPENVAIVEPERAAAGAQPQSTLLTYAAGKIEAVSPASMKSLWPKAIDCPYQPHCLLVTVDHFVFATSFELFAVDRRTGAVTWRVPVTPGSHDAADLVDSDQWVRLLATDDSILAIDTRRQFLCIDAGSGGVRWRVALVGEIPEHVKVSGQTAYCLRRAAAGNTLDAVALGDGHTIASIQLADADGRLIAPPSGPVLLTNTEFIGFDAEHLRERWRHKLTRPILRRCFSVHDEYAFWLDTQGGLVSIDFRTGRVRQRDDIPLTEGAEWLAVVLERRFAVAGKSGMLVGIDLVTGSIVWRHSGRMLPYAQPPIVVGDELIVVNRIVGARRTPSDDSPRDRLLISRIELASGMSLAAGPAGDIVTEPLSQFRGLTLRNDAILLLDGPQIIGYVPSVKQGTPRR
ncbi:MAG: PQQ-binding-like beta-propeller repeat protein [Phycisphaerales bacterium]|nr:PQQ-binding-like beta-propeller repeat protein [Phycisphaerales bacterium]MCB9856906.1 PQQ-binding-like beta-propeller repeat protein [Phycisphaerales bacterium]MCB9861967.1 PQQ-binding-like beta-propeller repeat protein [Phycisphaerales bacterium]